LQTLANPKGDFDPESTVSSDVAVFAGITKAKKQPALEQLRGPGAPRSYPLGPGETVIGRGTQANVTIESALLSRRHVAVRRSGPEHSFVDLDSANGVYLNGVRAHSAVLHDGDTLQIGDVVFVFHESGE
jgi:pSer/pThr/pTyr-binding forkhead associated (FHA) protein